VKAFAWLAGIGTLVAGAAYMLVSLHRWEWNRALFFGLIVVIAEIGLATALVLRKLGQLADTRAADPMASAVRDSRPPAPHRFQWLKDSTTGQLNVFVTFLVGGGIVLSGVAWLLDRVASATATPIAEGRLARRLEPIRYPHGGLLVDQRAVITGRREQR
jgi:hypothetical protein